MVLPSPKFGKAGFAAEKKFSQRIGGRLTSGSGNSSGRGGQKGDVHLDTPVKFKVECKSTVNESLSLKLEWLRKITGEAFHTGREAAVSIMFTNASGEPVTGGKWVMVPERVFQELTEGKPE